MTILEGVLGFLLIVTWFVLLGDRPVKTVSNGQQAELEPFGFLDLETGRRKAFDNETGEEYFVD